MVGLAARAAVIQRDGRELLLALTGRAGLPASFSVVELARAPAMSYRRVGADDVEPFAPR